MPWTEKLGSRNILRDSFAANSAQKCHAFIYFNGIKMLCQYLKQQQQQQKTHSLL